MNEYADCYRTKLSALADKLHVYSTAIRNRGFECCHVRDDWIQHNCDPVHIELHRKYEVEYAKVAILADKSSNILFTDDSNTSSVLINELKRKRLEKYGKVDVITDSSETFHNVELSPCLRELARITESNKKSDVKVKTYLENDFLNRRSNEISRFSQEIMNCDDQFNSDTNEDLLQKKFAEFLAMNLQDHHPELIVTNQQYGEHLTLVFKLNKEFAFCLIPLITCTDCNRLSEYFQGKVGMAFRIASVKAFGYDFYNKEYYSVLNLNELLPSKYIDYGSYNSYEEFCLNVLSWTVAIQVILPDILWRIKGIDDKLNEKGDGGIKF